MLLLTLPTAAGTGALFLCAAIRTRGVGGAFACAAALMLVWMVSMVVVRGGDGSPGLASLIDPSAYAEVEEQANLWTPREKAAAVLETTPPLVANRLIWTFPPLLLLVVVLRRANRERLTLEPAPAERGPGRAADEPRADAAGPGPPPLAPPARPSWIGATCSEAVWHFALSFRGWATPLALLILAAMGVGGSFVHVVLHADGPLLPRPHLVGPLLLEFYYLIIVFMVAGFVGTMARRDDRLGYGEIADATPAPLGSRVAGRALAAAAVTVVFALTPVLAVWIVVALVVPDAFSLLDPLLYFGLRLAPSLLELCALVLLAHAVVRHAGAAHAIGAICAFFIVVNNELGVTTYPPAEFGVPPSITLSEFSGWSPWLAYLLTADLFKLAVAARDRRPGLARLAARHHAHHVSPMADRRGEAGRRGGGGGRGRRRAGRGSARRPARTAREAGRLRVRRRGDGGGRRVGGALVGRGGAVHGDGRRGDYRDRPGAPAGNRSLAPRRRALELPDPARLAAPRRGDRARHRRRPGGVGDRGAGPLRVAARRVRSHGFACGG